MKKSSHKIEQKGIDGKWEVYTRRYHFSIGDLEVNNEEIITEIIQENIPELMIMIFWAGKDPRMLSRKIKKKKKDSHSYHCGISEQKGKNKVQDHRPWQHFGSPWNHRETLRNATIWPWHKSIKTVCFRGTWFMMTVENHSPESFQREKPDHLQGTGKLVSLSSSTIDKSTVQ